MRTANPPPPLPTWDGQTLASGPARKPRRADPIWQELSEKLPTRRTEEDRQERKRLFGLFDPNGNGYLSLAEIDRGTDEEAINTLFCVSEEKFHTFVLQGLRNIS